MLPLVRRRSPAPPAPRARGERLSRLGEELQHDASEKRLTQLRTLLAHSQSHPPFVIMPVTVQKPAPEFTGEAVMPDGSFKTIKLSDYKGERWENRAHKHI